MIAHVTHSRADGIPLLDLGEGQFSRISQLVLAEIFSVSLSQRILRNVYPNRHLTNIDNIRVCSITKNRVKTRNVVLLTKLQIYPVLSLCEHGKPADHSASYRPISPLPSLSKMFERNIKDKHSHHCDDEAVLPENHYGCRDRILTIHLLVIL